MDHEEILRDGGYASRKLVFALVTTGLIFGGAVLTAFWPDMKVAYEACVTGLLGTLGIYVGANTASKWVTTKNLTVAHAQKEVPDDPVPREPEGPEDSC